MFTYILCRWLDVESDGVRIFMAFVGLIADFMLLMIIVERIFGLV